MFATKQQSFEMIPQTPETLHASNFYDPFAKDNNMKHFILLSTLCLATACAETTTTAPAAVDPITAAVSGKSLVNGDAIFNVGSEGSLTGTNGTADFVGTWEVRDGKWCRTFSEPANFAGSACQEAVLGDGTITITGERGPITWTIS